MKSFVLKGKLSDIIRYLKSPQIFIDTGDMEERYGEELYKDYLKEQLIDYKSRCEKAIELLQKYGNGTFDDDLLNILQNGSDEE